MAMETEMEERKGGKRTRWIAARHKYLVFGGGYFTFLLFPGCALVVFYFYSSTFDKGGWRRSWLACMMEGCTQWGFALEAMREGSVF